MRALFDRLARWVGRRTDHADPLLDRDTGPERLRHDDVAWPPGEGVAQVVEGATTEPIAVGAVSAMSLRIFSQICADRFSASV